MTNMLLPILCFLPMVMGLVAYIVGRKNKSLRSVIVGGTGIVIFLLTVALFIAEEAEWSLPGFAGMGLHLKADGFRSLYACVASFMWMMTGLFAPEYFAHYHNRGRYSFFNLMTLGATLGVFLSDDLYTTFIFFEVMSFTSYTWVAHEENPGAMKAAGTYLAVAVIGGLTTLMGMFMLWAKLGTLSFDGMRAAMEAENVPDITVATWLTLVGFAGKAGMFPVHIWLPKAHPVAPAPASALLSGILTKSGVFGMIVIASRLMAGNEAFGNGLLVLASITMFLGALLALFSVDLKRTLACSSMSQIGFISVGLSMMMLLGEHGTLAAYGSVLHMVNHSLIKLVLFMAAGVVYMNLHKLNLNDVRGFGRKQPVLHAAFLLGALSIACIPPIGSGYNSKSLLHEAILEYIIHLQEHHMAWGYYKFIEVMFLISGGLTVAYMTKIYICIFWEKHPTKQEAYDAKKAMNPLSSAVLLLSAIVLPFLGALPEQLMSPLAARSMHFLEQHAADHAIPYFSLANLTGAAWSIGIGAVIYFGICRPFLMKKNADGVKEYVNLWPAKLDLEELVYRPVLMDILPKVTGAVCGFIAGIPDSKVIRKIIPQIIVGIVRFISEIPEMLTVGLRNTILRKRQTPKKIPVGNRVTWTLGQMMNFIARIMNRTVMHRHHIRTDFEYVLDASWKEIREGMKTLTVSVSFGLLLLCVGLYLTCWYLMK